MAHPVNWFQIQGSDGRSLQSFYKKVFAWKMSPDPSSPMMMVAPEPNGIPGGVGPTMDGQNASVAVYIGVDDLVAQLAKIEKAGGRAVMQPMELPAGMGSIAGFLDPAGNWIGLWQPAAKAAAPKPAASKKAAKARAKAPAKKPVAKARAKKAAAKAKPKARAKKK